MSGRDEWILVRSLDELFPGCAVRGVCGWCGGAHIGTITKRIDLSCGPAWDTTIVCSMSRSAKTADPYVAIAAPSIERGMVFRLRDLADGQEEKAATPKTLARAK